MDFGPDAFVVDLDERPAGRGIAVEHVAGAAAVDDGSPADLPDLGHVGVSANDDLRVGPADSIDRDNRIEVRAETVCQRSGRGVAEEDQVAVRRHVVADAQPALRRQPAQVVHAVVADLIAGPFDRGQVRVRRAVGEPRESRGEVAVGHGHVRVAERHERARLLQLLDECEAAGGVRAVEDQVAADRHIVRASRVDGLVDRGERGQVAVDVGEGRDLDHQLRALAGAMMKASFASQATSPSTVAMPWPRPYLLPRRSIVTSRRS